MKLVQARWYHRGRISPIRLIVVHSMEWVERPTTAEECAKMFATMNRQASAHACVDANSVVRCVRDQDTAWAAPGGNADGLQLELAGFARQTRAEWLDAYGKAMLGQAAGVIAGWARAHKIPVRRLTRAELRAGKRGITSHADISAVYRRSDHSDPGGNFPWDVLLDLVAGELGDAAGREEVEVPAWKRPLSWPPTTKGDDVKVWQRQMRKRGWRLDVDGWYSGADGEACMAFQEEKGLKATGVVDEATWRAAWTAPIT
ncbi:N-acetylmuramoyl-L-alanine amidase [Actinomadura sp. ATCC 31491]|uniref:N-acetylmuramoyl-L-alanine amidase n=1 Tax=Actinomadura luzonensis TaxID=2805427 RepID=A0ABT0FQL3_9ACTN|nr:peptidoglycan-binding domain-containing protein [Actinomadura luzonensis]MCK2214305.1 N-acetylmuramoyl-L-alanine amidase [Actinomadura luzonensis]